MQFGFEDGVLAGMVAGDAGLNVLEKIEDPNETVIAGDVERRALGRAAIIWEINIRCLRSRMLRWLQS